MPQNEEPESTSSQYLTDDTTATNLGTQESKKDFFPQRTSKFKNIPQFENEVLKYEKSSESSLPPFLPEFYKPKEKIDPKNNIPATGGYRACLVYDRACEVYIL